MSPNDCPFGSQPCPKVRELEERLNMLEATQARMVRILYYIAGIVSVSLGVTVMI